MQSLSVVTTADGESEVICWLFVNTYSAAAPQLSSLTFQLNVPEEHP